MKKYHLTSSEGPLGVLTWDRQCRFQPDVEIAPFILSELERGIERLNQSWNGWAFYRVVPKRPFSIAYGTVQVGEEMSADVAHRVFSHAFHMRLTVSETD